MGELLIKCLAVGGAGALGAISRFLVARLFSWTTLPLGTLFINISGALFLGWFYTRYGERIPINDTLRAAVGIGFVGAYTTFSTYMFEADKMFRDGSSLEAETYLLGSLVLGLVAVRVGFILGRG